MSDDQDPPTPAAPKTEHRGQENLVSQLSAVGTRFYNSTESDLNADNPMVRFRGAIKRDVMRGIYASVLVLLLSLLISFLITATYGFSQLKHLLTIDVTATYLSSTFVLFYSAGGTDWLPKSDDKE